MTESRLIQVCLIGVIFPLLLVGVVSATPLRHLVQATPAAFALVPIWRRNSWAVYAAIPVFLFWFAIMLLIWLFLLGITTIITGSFSAAEIALSISIGAFCLLGLTACFRAPVLSPVRYRILGLLAFAALQVGRVWLSVQPFVSHR